CRIGLEVPRYRIAEHITQRGARLACHFRRVAAGNRLLFPPGNAVCGNRRKRQITERWQDMYFNVIAVVTEGPQLKIKSWIPAVGPLSKSDPSGSGVDVSVEANSRFLVLRVLQCFFPAYEAALRFPSSVRAE